jgi:hypothetical protein
MRKMPLGLLLQIAIIGGVAGYLITLPEPWARYGLVGFFVFLTGKMAWRFKQAGRWAK